MLFNNVDKSIKRQILEENYPKYEKDVYEILIKLALDPDEFDPSTFEVDDPSIKPDDQNRALLYQELGKALDSLNMINNQILLLEN
jgi:hypothetical protein